MGTIEYLDGFDDYTAAQGGQRGWVEDALSSMVAGRVAGQAAKVAGNIRCTRNVTPDAEYSVGFAWYNEDVSESMTLLYFYEDSTLHGSLRYNSTGTFSILNSAGTVLGASSDQGLVNNTFVHLEVNYKVGTSNGAYELRLNGAAIIGPTTDANTRNGGTGVINKITLACVANSNGVFDDLVITKGGGFQGDCRVITQYPSADGANTAWTRVSPVRVQAIGTKAEGTGDISPAWPAHEPGDIALLFVEACGGQAIALGSAAGFTEVTNSPQATGSGTAGTRLAVFWCRATSTSMSAPTVTDPSDHAFAVIITFRGCLESGDPIDITGGGVKAAASTTFTATGVTTSVGNAMVVVAVSEDLDSNAGNFFSGWTNANLSGLVELFDQSTSNGNGGGIGIAAGTKVAAGATGDTTGSVSSSINAFLTVALKPGSADYTAVDDSLTVAGHDSDTSYLASATPGDRETFDFPALGVTGTVKAVAISHVSRKDDAGTRTISTVVRQGGTNYDETAVTVNAGYIIGDQIYETDPSTDAAWTVAGVDSAEFGVKVGS